MNLLIKNKYKYHYEIIESIILKYNLIINKSLKGVNIYFSIGHANGVLGDAVIIAPPFIIKKEEIDEIVNILHQVIKKVSKTCVVL